MRTWIFSFISRKTNKTNIQPLVQCKIQNLRSCSHCSILTSCKKMREVAVIVALNYCRTRTLRNFHTENLVDLEVKRTRKKDWWLILHSSLKKDFVRTVIPIDQGFKSQINNFEIFFRSFRQLASVPYAGVFLPAWSSRIVINSRSWYEL